MWDEAWSRLQAGHEPATQAYNAPNAGKIRHSQSRHLKKDPMLMEIK